MPYKFNVTECRGSSPLLKFLKIELHFEIMYTQRNNMS